MGNINVSSGQTVSGIVSYGTSETILSGGASFDLVINSGTSLGFASYAEIASGGTMTNGIISGSANGGGAMDVQSGGAISGGLTFAGSGGYLSLDTGAVAAASISGFAAGDTIALAAFNYNANETVSVSTPGIVTVTSGTQTYNLNIAGATSADQFLLFGTNRGTGPTGLEVAAGTPAPAMPAPQMSFIAPHVTVASTPREALLQTTHVPERLQPSPWLPVSAAAPAPALAALQNSLISLNSAGPLAGLTPHARWA